MVVRELLTKWGFEVDDSELQRMDAQLGEARDKADALGRNFRELSRGAVDLGKNLTTFVTLPIAGLGAGMLKLAGDAENMQLLFDRVFKGMTEDVEEWASDTAEAHGRSRVAIKGYAAELQSILEPMGFAREEGAAMSKQMVELASDLAALMGTSPDQAINAFTSALTGEFEAMKQYGIVLRASQVEQRALEMGLADTKDELDQVAKAQATMNIITERSDGAIGAAARRTETFNKSLSALWAHIKDAGTAFGNIFLPVATKVVQKIDELVLWMGELNEGTKTVLLTIGGLAAILGPLIATLGLVGLAAMALRTGLTFLAAAWRALGVASLWAYAKMLIMPALILALIAFFGMLAEDIYRFVKGQRSLTGELVGMWDEAWEGMKLAAKRGWKNMKDFYSALWDDIVELTKTGASNVADFYGTWANTLLTEIQTLGMKLKQAIMGALNSMLDQLDEWGRQVYTRIISAFQRAVNKARELASYIPFVDLTQEGEAQGGRPDATGGPRPRDLPGGGGLSPSRMQQTAPKQENNIEVPITLPPGSTEEQGRFAREAAQMGVEEALDKMLRRGLMAYPQVE